MSPVDLSLFSLEDKVALVTGATFGLGRAMSIALAGAGADISGVGSSGLFDETRKAVEAIGRKFYGIKADLLKMESVGQVVAATLDQLGRIDILVNNAGIIRRAETPNFTEKDWDEVMNVNVKAAFFLSQEVVKVFRKQGSGGKIINICSMLSFQGGLYVPSYTASKSALLGITRSLANELAAEGINVNAIAPGYIIGRGNKAIRDDPKRSKEILSRIPAGHWGKPENLAGVAIFLSSRASDYCHGGVYPVDGGWLAR
jgi:2-deoxy-D-gluconate 3-dehydrogenase